MGGFGQSTLLWRASTPHSRRRAGALFSLVPSDGLGHVGVLRPGHQTSAAERSQAMLGLRQPIGHQVKLAGLFGRGTALRVDAQRGVAVALGSGHVGGLALGAL